MSQFCLSPSHSAKILPSTISIHVLQGKNVKRFAEPTWPSSETLQVRRWISSSSSSSAAWTSFCNVLWEPCALTFLDTSIGSKESIAQTEKEPHKTHWWIKPTSFASAIPSHRHWDGHRPAQSARETNQFQGLLAMHFVHFDSVQLLHFKPSTYNTSTNKKGA